MRFLIDMKPFTQRSIDFLYFNFKHNSKAWYSEHKDDFKQFVQLPMQDLVSALAPSMLTIDSQFVTEPKSCVSRLYKDLHFAKDKTTLYRDHMWLEFTRDKHSRTPVPSFYFELSPYNFSYGCGFYYMDGALLKAMQKLILEDSTPFKKANECLKAQNVFHIAGEEYTHAKFDTLDDDKKIWLNRKFVYFTTKSTDINLLLSQNLHETLAKHFTSIKPIYDFFMQVHLLAQQ